MRHYCVLARAYPFFSQNRHALRTVLVRRDHQIAHKLLWEAQILNFIMQNGHSEHFLFYEKIWFDSQKMDFIK